MFKDVNDGFCPQVYYTEPRTATRLGVIFMEDFSDTCVTTGLLMTGTIEQFWNVAKKVAHFQVVAEGMKDKWTGKFRDGLHINTNHEIVFPQMIEAIKNEYPG
jgi:hypothetical protein